MAIPPVGSLVRFIYNKWALLRTRDGSPNEASEIFVQKGTFEIPQKGTFGIVQKGTFGIVVGIVTADMYHYAHVFVATGGYVYVSPNWLEVISE